MKSQKAYLSNLSIMHELTSTILQVGLHVGLISSGCQWCTDSACYVWEGDGDEVSDQGLNPGHGGHLRHL